MNKCILSQVGYTAFSYSILLLTNPALALDLVFPDDAQVNIVSEHMSVNGLPLLAYEFTSPDDGSSALKFYRNHWQEHIEDADTEQAYLETTIGQWQVLSRLEDEHNITVQIGNRTLAGSQVLVGISPLPKYLENGFKNTSNNSLPELGRASIISLVRSTSGNDAFESYWLESADSVESTLTYYADYYSARRYQINRKRVVDEINRSTEAAMLTAVGPTKNIRIDAIKMDDKTRLIATITKQAQR
ncbi:hypothetical protein PVT68_11660 [Microbulbifer bruguierae]|uniref:Uncharacterized protein n=1 Tax=Microbulbifer bruguierae TaxID=3029061 RepID=A0ABY8NAH7_9GAMM|nr:hypothetical protein [Microbulbifer bruguierae]WGL15424.1 hypothetical protein PVT68_11660 [Microbulbifer bruguierae]